MPARPLHPQRDAFATQGLNPAGGPPVELTDDGGEFKLLELQDGVTAVLAERVVDPGRYLWLRLVVSAANVVLADGFAWDRRDPGRQLESAEAFRLAEAKFETLAATGSYNTPERGGDYRGGTIGASPAY